MPEDAGVLAGDAVEKRLNARLEGIYLMALETAWQNQRRFLRKVADVDAGRIKPPAFYDTPEKVAKWRQGFIREAMRQADVVKSIARSLTEVGGTVSDDIREAMAEVYAANRAYTCEAIGADAGANVSFAQYDKRQIGVLMQEGQSPFSKIAYKNLGADAGVRRRLQHELAQATMLGESQRQILKRIRDVTGQRVWQARRVAQTERTRVQSQARNQAIDEAAAMGIDVARKWTTRMVNSRDTHVALNGQEAPAGEAFKLSDGDRLMYPGDPSGRAENVINCHCVLVPVVGKGKAGRAHEHARSIRLGEDAIKVDSAEIASQQYRMLYHGITGKTDVDDRICDYARQMLRHRSGTHGEDLVLMDADTGALIYRHTTSTRVDGVAYTRDLVNAIERALQQGRRILALHNHPTGYPPTAEDCVSARAHGYAKGVVCGHNGTVYTYLPSERNYSLDERDEIHNIINLQVIGKKDVDNDWLNVLESYRMIVERR